MMIRASAGTGKTFQLTNRFIRLLLCGQAPERIIALTFTRKAAGEFFEGILDKLAKAADDPLKATELAKGMGHPGAGQVEFRTALRRLVDSMGHLSLGTIDSFFHRVLGLFSTEFGLGGQFEMMDEFEMDQARLTVLEQMLVGRQVKKNEQDDLIKSYQLATAGRNNRDFVGAFAKHLEECHELLLRVPGVDCWGDPVRIWPAGNPWVREKVDLAEMVADWRELLETEEFGKQVNDAFSSIADHLMSWEPGKDLFEKSKTMMKRAFEGLGAMRLGDWEFKFGNTKSVNRPSVEFSQKLAGILRHCVASELETRLARTRGIHGLLDAFEKQYDSRVRRTGRLTFSDLPVLLAPAGGRGLLGGTGPDRLALEYRLDGAFDHWLLDEFQDTSTVQWRAVANLVDEVVQDASGERTFFCVGDQKQSVYQWRGGDPKLFDRVEAFYSQAGADEFSTDSLNKSWRSCPDVLKMVNRVFGDAAKLAPFDDNRTAADRWAGIWQEHESADNRAGDNGHSMYLQVDEKEDRWPVVAQLLKKLQPIKNRLECAILVQTNKATRELVNHLRGAGLGMPIVGESATNPGADNPLSVALLSLFRAAAHPEDRFGIGHLRLTPLAKLLPSDFTEWPSALREVQRAVYRHGFEAVARDWITRLTPVLDEFGRWRAPLFLELARQFDQSGSRDIDAFLRFIPAQEITEASGASVVQVMTIHKAKGLTFDITIVPDLEGNRLDQTRKESLHTHRAKDGEVDWILDLPSKNVCQQDEPLAEAVAEARSEVCYESFCKLYVALTRPSHGLYVVTTKPGSSQNYLRLLSDTLAGGEDKPFGDGSARIVSEEGNFDWVKAKQPKPLQSIPEPRLVEAKRGHARLVRRRASVDGSVIRSGTQLFASGSPDAISFGLAVHKVFEQIDWVDEQILAKLEPLRDTMPAKAVDEVARCLADDALAKRLARPEGDAEFWRERAFDVVVGNEMISGVFDRVHLFADRAEIIDFKTDRVGDEASLKFAVEKYSSQMTTYRLALAKFTGFGEAAIRCSLVFTHPRSVVEV
ncbi:MAG: UvrD-helicase domain-containing protein [Verrucomicrobiota bacterium]|jgi:ATP-dependent helicase/nuclease subunit A|nr:UvrD-helicase domain-containing protein [Verrucomicrobiota bacterium]